MQGRSKEYASRAAARGANLQVALRHRWSNWKYGADTRETTSPKIVRNLGTRPQNIRPPLQKKSKNVSWKGAKSVLYPGVPNCYTSPGVGMSRAGLELIV
jgi:hypothetical protein